MARRKLAYNSWVNLPHPGGSAFGLGLPTIKAVLELKQGLTNRIGK
jgi:hypothetical protein